MSLVFDTILFGISNRIRLSITRPKTQTVSDIEGVIEVEKNEDEAKGIGGSLNGRFPEMVNGSIKADLSSRTGSTG